MPGEDEDYKRIISGFEEVARRLEKPPASSEGTPGENALSQSVRIEASCERIMEKVDRIHPFKLLKALKKNPVMRELLEKELIKVKEGTESGDQRIIERIAERQVAIAVINLIRDILHEDGQELTLRNAARLLNVEEGREVEELGVEGEAGEVVRVSKLDELFVAAVELEAGSGGEDLITLQALIDCGQLYVVRQGGSINGVMGLIFDVEGGVIIHRLGILGEAYGRGVASKLLEKAVEAEGKLGVRRLRYSPPSSEENIKNFFEGQRFQLRKVRENYYGDGRDLEFLERSLTGEPVPDELEVHAEDRVCVNDRGEKISLTLDDGEYSLYELHDFDSIKDVVKLEESSYPVTAEGMCTVINIAFAGGLFGVKDNGRVVAALELFHARDGKKVFLHGVPADEKEYGGVRVELIKAVPELTRAERMVCKTFPADWEINSILKKAGGWVSGYEERPITDINKPEKCPVYEWYFEGK